MEVVSRVKIPHMKVGDLFSTIGEEKDEPLLRILTPCPGVTGQGITSFIDPCKPR